MSPLKPLFSMFLCSLCLLSLPAQALDKDKEFLAGQYQGASKSQALYSACGVDGTPELQAMRAYGYSIGLSSSDLDLSEKLTLTYRNIYLQQLKDKHFECKPEHKAKFQQDTQRITAGFKQMRQEQLTKLINSPSKK
jgi:hypothetical protein